MFSSYFVYLVQKTEDNNIKEKNIFLYDKKSTHYEFLSIHWPIHFYKSQSDSASITSLVGTVPVLINVIAHKLLLV